MSALSMYFCFQPEMKPLGKAEQQLAGHAWLPQLSSA
jgi:hypothetical protein